MVLLWALALIPLFLTPAAGEATADDCVTNLMQMEIVQTKVNLIETSKTDTTFANAREAHAYKVGIFDALGPYSVHGNHYASLLSKLEQTFGPALTSNQGTIPEVSQVDVAILYFPGWEVATTDVPALNRLRLICQANNATPIIYVDKQKSRDELFELHEQKLMDILGENVDVVGSLQDDGWEADMSELASKVDTILSSVTDDAQSTKNSDAFEVDNLLVNDPNWGGGHAPVFTNHIYTFYFGGVSAKGFLISEGTEYVSLRNVASAAKVKLLNPVELAAGSMFLMVSAANKSQAVYATGSIGDDSISLPMPEDTVRVVGGDAVGGWKDKVLLRDGWDAVSAKVNEHMGMGTDLFSLGLEILVFDDSGSATKLTSDMDIGEVLNHSIVVYVNWYLPEDALRDSYP